MIRTLTIPGEPVAKGRPRVTSKGVAYTPQKTVNYETLVKELWAIKHSAEKPLEGPLCVYINAYFAIPKSWSKKKRQDALNEAILPTGKRDCDNVAKSLLDALNQLAYADDAQVTTLIVQKKYSERPRAELIIFSDDPLGHNRQNIFSQLFPESQLHRLSCHNAPD